MGHKLDQALAILNGTIGDYLASTNNGLATVMGQVVNGFEVPADAGAEAMRQAYPRATSRVVVLVHGLMCTETCWAMTDGTDYGSRLANDLGTTPVYVRYNSGRSVLDNGRDLAALLECIVATYPVAIEELVLLGYSMGGLVVRAACGQAWDSGRPWVELVTKALYVGTPHLGAPLERGGRLLARLLGSIPDPTTRLIGQIGDLRSHGIKDLGDGSPVPLLPRIRHYLVAGTMHGNRHLGAIFGDALVPVGSATDGTCPDIYPAELPPSHVSLFPAVGHVELARHPRVYQQILAWCEETA